MIYIYRERLCAFCDKMTKHRHAVDGPTDSDIGTGVCVPCDIDSEIETLRSEARMESCRERDE